MSPFSTPSSPSFLNYLKENSIPSSLKGEKVESLLITIFPPSLDPITLSRSFKYVLNVSYCNLILTISTATTLGHDLIISCLLYCNIFHHTWLHWLPCSIHSAARILMSLSPAFTNSLFCVRIARISSLWVESIVSSFVAAKSSTSWLFHLPTLSKSINLLTYPGYDLKITYPQWPVLKLMLQTIWCTAGTTVPATALGCLPLWRQNFQSVLHTQRSEVSFLKVKAFNSNSRTEPSEVLLPQPKE